MKDPSTVTQTSEIPSVRLLVCMRPGVSVLVCATLRARVSLNARARVYAGVRLGV